MRYSRLLLFFLALLVLLPGKPRGQSLDDSLNALGEVSPLRLEGAADIPDGGIEDFPAPILREAVLLQYSRWTLHREGKIYPLSSFEVLDSQAAFGLFSRSRRSAGEGEKTTLGVDSVFADRTLHFWRGHYFFRLGMAEGGSRQDLLDVARRLVEAIDEPNLHPMSVVQLPVQDLDQESIEFFLGPAGLAECPEFPPPLRSILGFEDSAEVAVGRYGPDRHPLFLIGYPTASLAEDYFARIQSSLSSYFSSEGVYSKRSGLLISIFPGPEEEAAALLDQVRYTATVRWLYEKDNTLEEARRRRGETGTFLGTVTAAILFTGAFILAVAAMGVLAGLFRFWLIRRVPAFQRRDDMVRLDLSGPPSSTL